MNRHRHTSPLLTILALLLAAWTLPAQAAGDEPAAQQPRRPRMVARQPGHRQVDSTATSAVTPPTHRVSVVEVAGDTLHFAGADSIVAPQAGDYVAHLGKRREFNPDPKRALWMSALCPGLGQIYNRRYWKLPIVVGAFVGLGYGTAWNNRMLNDYTKAYRDITDNDPGTRSYMDFYPPTTQESSIDKSWLQNSLKNKRTYYRRYRDLCIIGMVAVYALAIIDAYVDASLAHFDVSPDLSLRVRPAVMEQRGGGGNVLPGLGVGCAVTF